MTHASKGLPAGFDRPSYFYTWRDAGLWQTINHLLVMSTRELEGREASPRRA